MNWEREDRSTKQTIGELEEKRRFDHEKNIIIFLLLENQNSQYKTHDRQYLFRNRHRKNSRLIFIYHQKLLNQKTHLKHNRCENRFDSPYVVHANNDDTNDKDAERL